MLRAILSKTKFTIYGQKTQFERISSSYQFYESFNIYIKVTISYHDIVIKYPIYAETGKNFPIQKKK